MIKQLFHLTLSACAAVILAAACQAVSLEDEIVVPAGQEKPAVSPLATVPYTMTVDTESTRVSYETGEYAFKSGDKLHVVGVDRPDLEGYLSQNGEVWSGELTYDTSLGEQLGDPTLSITLVHADNDDESTYGTAIVGRVREESTLLQDAVELYSLFTNEGEVKYSDHAATLKQRATFLDVTVEFDFDGSHIIDAGEALVDLKIKQGKEVTVDTHFIEKPNTNGEDFYVHFMAVIPGNKTANDFTLTVGDRKIEFKAENLTKTLECNHRYTISRVIKFRPEVGDPFWSDGTYGRLRHPDAQEHIVGIVVFVHDYKENMTDEEIRIADAITEKRSDENGKQLFGHGLVMALTNAAVDVSWSSAAGKIPCTGGDDYYVDTPEKTLHSNHLSGYSNTNSIIDVLTRVNAVSGSAAKIAKDYTYNGIAVSTASTTGWFLPSIGQWMYTISKDGFGKADPASQWVNGNGISWLVNNYHEDDQNDNDDPDTGPSGNLGDLVLVKKCEDDQHLNELVKSLNDRLEQFKTEFKVTYQPFGDPSTTNNVSDNYWTSSEKDATNAIRMNLGSVRRRGKDYYSTIKVKGEEKTKITVYTENGVNYNMKVRPFLAF